MNSLIKYAILVSGLGLLTYHHAIAQLHYQGHQGVQASYGIRTQFSDYYSIGYQFFLNNRFQLELNGGYERGNYQHHVISNQYKADVSYRIENYFMHETLDYSFLRAFKRLYFNLGIGLTQSYQQPETIDVAYSVDSLRLASLDDPQDFNSGQVTLGNKVRFGGHANLLTELYLGRYVTLLTRHRLVYMIRSSYDQWEQQTTVGLRINF